MATRLGKERTMQEEQDPHSLLRPVPGHLFKFEEKIWGMSLQQLLMDLGVLAGSFSFTASVSLVPRVLICLFITLLAMLLVHGSIQGQALGYWCYLYLRSTLRPAETVWRSSRMSREPATPQKGKVP